MEEIKLICPICKDIIILDYLKTIYKHRDRFGIECTNCEFKVEGREKDRDKIISTWNTRTDGWISVEDKLPEEGEELDLWDDVHGVRIPNCYFKDNEVISKYMQWSGKYTYWQPLPQSPKEGE